MKNKIKKHHTYLLLSFFLYSGYLMSQATVYSFNTPSGGTVNYYLQAYNLSDVAMDHVYSGVNAMYGQREAVYLQNTKSPRFLGMTASETISSYNSLWGNKIQAVMNTAFLESPDIVFNNPFPIGPSQGGEYDHTASFPLKLNGTIVTGGSSEYGPGGDQCGTPLIFCGTLRAFVWDNASGTAGIDYYNPATGYPLNNWPNGIVSYAPEHHPASATTDKEKIHIMATNGSQVIVLTSATGQETIPEVSGRFMDILISDFNFQGNELLITMDGGSSTLLYTPSQDFIASPAAGGVIPRALAFYLGFRDKGPSPRPKKIIIRSPTFSHNNSYDSYDYPSMAVDSTFLIMYETNLPSTTQMKIELYSGSPSFSSNLIRVLEANTENTGVYEWTPNSSDLTCAPFPNNFYIKISESAGSVYDQAGPFKIVDPEGELIVNGDFECDVTNVFNTDYTESNNLFNSAEGKYNITALSASLNPNFSSCSDNSPNDGVNMMAVNGYITPNSVVWEQTVSGFDLDASTEYVLGFSATNLSPNNTTRLQLLLNGVVKDTLVLNCGDECSWKRLETTFLKPAFGFTDYKVSIVSLNSGKEGHDFAIDDISLKKKKPQDTIINESATSCIILEQPTLGGGWAVNDSVYIRWKDNLIENVKIDLIRAYADTLITTLAASTESDGEYTWNPNILDVADCGTNLKIRITSVDNSSLKDESDGVYTLLNANGSEAVPCDDCNIVENGGFEGPAGYGISPSPWVECDKTPDTFPNYEIASPLAYEGNTYAGLVALGDFWIESMGQPISLVAGNTYEFSLALARTTSFGSWEWSPYSLPTGVDIFVGSQSCNSNQLLWSSPIVSSSVWQVYTFTFTPVQNYSYVKLQVQALPFEDLGNILIDDFKVCDIGPQIFPNCVGCKTDLGGVKVPKDVNTRTNVNSTNSITSQNNVSAGKSIITYSNGSMNNVKFSIKSERNNFELNLYDLKGRLIKNFYYEGPTRSNISNESPNVFYRNTVDWDGTGNNGGPVNSGIYIYQFKSGTTKSSGKIIYQPK